MPQPASKRLLTEANAAAQASDSATPFGAALSATILDQTEGPIAAAVAPKLDAANPKLILAPAATRGLTYSSGLSDGSVTSTTYKTRHRSVRHITDLSLVFLNTYNNVGGETIGPNDITVKCSIEIPDADLTRVGTSFNGKRSITIEPGCRATTDPLAVEIPANTYFYVYTYVSVTTLGQKWPVGLNTVTADGEGRTASNDYTTAGAVSATSVFAYSPAQLLSPIGADQRVLGGIGDSIMTGNGDGNTRGFWARGIERYGDAVVPPVLASQRISYPSETALGFDKPERAAYRLPLLASCTHIVCEMGVNDIKNGRTTANLQSALLSMWTKAGRRGAKVYQTTLTPVTTSTDSFATIGNQTVTSGEASRVAFNDWLRAGSPIDSATKAAVAVGTSGALLAGSAGHPLHDYIELADTVETARNSGKWVVGYTSDGTHPILAGHTAMAAVFTEELFD